MFRQPMLLSRASGMLWRKFRQLPPVRAVLAYEYDRHFDRVERRVRMFRGVFKTWRQALASVPRHRGVSYNHPAAAAMFVEQFHWVFPTDYPVIFWLSRLLPQNPAVFDLGGNVGISVYSFEKYLDYPPGMKWTIFDVPNVVQHGERIAREKSRTDVRFTTRLEDAEGADILLASGSLQFIETPFPDTLRALHTKPRHLLINRTPLRAGPPFVTVQAMGTAYCAYHVFNEAGFIGGITELGYELIDRWEAPDFPLEIPFYPAESLTATSGLYFRATCLEPRESPPGAEN